MLVPLSRVFLARAIGFNAVKPLPIFKLGQFPLRALATATRKATTSKTKTTATRSKAPAKKAATGTKKATSRAGTSRAGTKKPATKAVRATSAKNSVKNKKKVPAKKVPAKKAAASRKTQKKPTSSRPKKKVTPEERQIIKDKEKVRTLLQTALKPPAIHTGSSAWIAFLKGKFGSTEKADISNVKEWTSEYKSLTPAELENLKAKAQVAKGDKVKALATWVKKHSPVQIYQANLARRQIRKMKRTLTPVPIGMRGPFSAIPDDRLPIRVRTPQVFYIMEKMSSLAQEKRASALGGLVKEYNALPAAGQKKYRDQAAADVTRFRNEMKAAGFPVTEK